MSLQGKTLFIWQIKVAKTAKAKLCATTKALWHKPKLCATKHGIGGPGGLPWSPQGRGEGLRERGKLRVEKVGFPSPFCLTTLQKVEFPCFFKSSKTQALCHNQSSVPQPKANYPKIRHSRITLLCLCRKKRCLFGKSKLQRRQKQSSVPRKINFHQIPGSLSPIFHIFKNKKLKGLIFGVNL